MASTSDERILMSSIGPVACIMISSHCHLIAGGGGGGDCSRRVNTETNYASCMEKKTTNSEKYKA